MPNIYGSIFPAAAARPRPPAGPPPLHLLQKRVDSTGARANKQEKRRKNTTACRYVMKGEICRFGDSCRFSHDEDVVKVAQSQYWNKYTSKEARRSRRAASASSSAFSQQQQARETDRKQASKQASKPGCVI